MAGQFHWQLRVASVKVDAVEGGLDDVGGNHWRVGLPTNLNEAPGWVRQSGHMGHPRISLGDARPSVGLQVESVALGVPSAGKSSASTVEGTTAWKGRNVNYAILSEWPAVISAGPLQST